ncbi:hypothetical protein LBMAG49_01540 [Planctomycetota bacterium]|nr:aminotransferase class IV [Planctomycetota bacterium]GDY00825.1 hypothetical protein LBMAG49_01540 [Planctomycetota bacterium]
MKWFDGALIEDDVAVAAGVIFAPFETMGATGFLLPLWSLHEARLVAALQRIGHSLPVPSDLLAIAADLLARNGHRDGVVRLSWCSLRVTGGWLLTTRTRSLQNSVSLLPCVVRRPPAVPSPDIKCSPRTAYDAVLLEARAGGADDGIVLGNDGALLETAQGNLWLLLDGSWVTPPLDGRVLPGIARGIMLERALSHGLPVAARACDLSDLHRAKAMIVSNAVYGPRAAHLPGADVVKLDIRFAALWRAAVSH